MRRFEGIMSEEEEEEYLNLTESFTYEEILDYWEQHPELLKETRAENIPVLDMTYEEYLKKGNDIPDYPVIKSGNICFFKTQSLYL